ncbi:MAG TPA: hypothetical protein VGU20_02240, partial [Stellaceae bacterium]|nr:hypothetical protein [Stellaceae bacterium]
FWWRSCGSCQTGGSSERCARVERWQYAGRSARTAPEHHSLNSTTDAEVLQSLRVVLICGFADMT